MSKDTDRLLGHSDEADGIEEYDNPLPDWWVGLFWLTIVWAFAYGIHYHFIGDRSQVASLAAEMAAADARYPSQAAAMAAAAAHFVITSEATAAGELVYATNCVPCHGANLEGGIGPAFVDAEWIHGGQATDILRTITVGVPEKGMIPWGQILSPEQINQVASFVITKHSEATGRSIQEILAEGGGDAPPMDAVPDSGLTGSGAGAAGH